MQIAETTLKPHLKKIGVLWVCYTQWDTITCCATSPEKAYLRWVAKNSIAGT